jgi:hypothetical protein
MEPGLVGEQQPAPELFIEGPLARREFEDRLVDLLWAPPAIIAFAQHEHTIARRPPNLGQGAIANCDPASSQTQALSAWSIVANQPAKAQIDHEIVDPIERTGPRFLSRVLAQRNGSIEVEQSSRGPRPPRKHVHFRRDANRARRRQSGCRQSDPGDVPNRAVTNLCLNQTTMLESAVGHSSKLLANWY